MPEKYIILVKGMYHQCQTVVTCAAGTSEPVAVEVGLHQGSAFIPFLFAIKMDSLTENIRNKAHWQIMFVDDVVLCAREKDVLELELEQWRGALEKRGMKVSRAKTEYMFLNGTPLGSVHVQSAQLPQVAEFKYLGSTLQSDGDMSAEIHLETVWMERREEDIRRPMRQESTTTCEGKDTQDARSASYAGRDGDSASE